MSAIIEKDLVKCKISISGGQTAALLISGESANVGVQFFGFHLLWGGRSGWLLPAWAVSVEMTGFSAPEA